MELESPPVPVSVTETAMLVVAPGAKVDGVGVAEDLKVRFGVYGDCSRPRNSNSNIDRWN